MIAAARTDIAIGSATGREIPGNLASEGTYRRAAQYRRDVTSRSLPLTRLADDAIAAPALALACRLADWIGDSRDLTSSGVLRPAVAAEACRDLNIERPGNGSLRSAKDVPELQQAWEVATAAGLVAVTSKRVSAAGDAAALAAAVRAAQDSPDGAVPPELAERVVAAWLSSAGIPLGLPEDPCPLCLTVLHELSLTGKPVEMTRLIAAVLEAMKGPIPLDDPGDGEDDDGFCPHCGQDHGTGPLGGPGGYLDEISLFEASGHAEESVDSLMLFGAAVTRPGSDPGGSVALTELGRMLADRVMTALAADPGISAGQLAEHVEGLPTGLALVASESWLGARQPKEAVRQLLGAAEAASGEPRRTALALAQAQGEAGRAAWRELAERPGFGAYARQWLESQGDSVETDDRDEAWLLVDSIVQASDTTPLPVVAAVFGQTLAQMSEDEADDVLTSVRECGHPSAAEVAGLLGSQPGGGAAGAMGLLAEMLGGGPAFALPYDADDEDGLGHVYDNDVPEGTLYQLKITLRGVSKPPVWRRVVVRADISLDELSDVVLRAMGWVGGHMHEFTDGITEFGVPDGDLYHADETEFELADLMSDVGEDVLYTYDFGDDWAHQIKLEKIIAPGTAAASRPVPECLAGKGQCPPEDCGGSWGYKELKQVLADPSHEEHEDLLDWLGIEDPAAFDPAAFSPDDANDRLRRLWVSVK